MIYIILRKMEIPLADWRALQQSHPALNVVPDNLLAGTILLSVSASSTLFRKGSKPKYMLFVVAGELRLIRYTFNGAEVILQRARTGFIAEASLETHRYHCDIEAVQESLVLGFPIAAFQTALTNNREFRRDWTCLLAQEVRRLRALCERLNLRKAEDRVVHFLEVEGARGVYRLLGTKKAWARELGLTHEVLYRTLRKLVAAERIHLVGDTIFLSNKSS